MAFVIRKGDPTTTGGIVVAGSSTHTVEFRQAARISDPVWCPACKSIGFIALGVLHRHRLSHGHPPACRAVRLPVRHHRLIATRSTVIADVQGSVGIAPALAVRAEAAT